MKYISTFFLMLIISIKAQYNVGVDLAYHPFIDEQLTYYDVIGTTTPQGYSYFYATSKYGNDFYLRKVLPTGYNDTTFGNNGISTSVLPLVYNSSQQTSYGRVVANDQFIFLSSKNIIARYNTNGSLDTSFGTAGYLTLANNVNGMTLNDDSTLFITTNSVMQKITMNGQLDTSFSNIPIGGGYQITNSAIIISGGSSQYKRYNMSGVQDMTFGISGIANIPGTYIKANKNTGELYTYSSGYPIEIKKYNANGILDTSFGTAGTASYSFPVDPNIYYPVSSDLVSGINIDGSNNILIYGGSSAGIDYMKTAFILRFTPNGNLDNSFNNGSALYYRQGSPYITNMRLLNDNTYLCTNMRRFGSMTYNYGITQYLRTTGALAVNEESLNSDIKFNNPFKNELSLISKEKIKSIELYDETGRIVLKGNNSRLNTSSLEKGNYFIKIITDSNKIISKKGIKN